MQRFSASTLAGDLLRIALGVMYLAHSLLLKIVIFGFAGTAQYFVSVGLPAALSYAVIAAEVIGGVLLIAGYKARETALVLMPILLGVVWVHAGNGWLFTNEGGGWEYPVFLIVVSIAVALNPGRVLVPNAPRPVTRAAAQATRGPSWGF